MADRQSEGIYASLQRSPHHPDLVTSPHELQQNDHSLDSQPNFDEELGLTHSDLQFLNDSHPFDGLPDSILDRLDIFSDIWNGNERGGGSGHAGVADIDAFSAQNNTEGVNPGPFDINQNLQPLSPSSQHQLDEILRETLGLPSTSDRPWPSNSNEPREGENRKRPTPCSPSNDNAIDSSDEPGRTAKRQCRDQPVDADNSRHMLPDNAGEVSGEATYTTGETPESNDSLGTVFSNKPDDLDSLFSDLEETDNNPTRGTSPDIDSIQNKPSQSASDGKACDSYNRKSTQYSLALPKAAHQPNQLTVQPLSTVYEDSGTFHHTPVDSVLGDVTTSNLPEAFQRHEPLPPLASDAQNQQFSQDPTSTSYQILDRNGLGEKDLVSTRVREVIRNTQVVPKYISPYPRVGGSLGYLPSNPTLHVKCVEVAPDEVLARLESYRKSCRTLAREKNKYMWENEEWKRANSGTCKSQEQILREELISLKRTLNARDKKAKEAIEEASAWRGAYRNLAVAYSNLLRRTAARPAVNTASPDIPPTPQPSHVNSPNAITADPIVRHDTEQASATDATQLPSPQPNLEALVAMQKRQYNWLPGQNSLHKIILPRPPTNNQSRRGNTQRGNQNNVGGTAQAHPSQQQTEVIQIEG